MLSAVLPTNGPPKTTVKTKLTDNISTVFLHISVLYQDVLETFCANKMEMSNESLLVLVKKDLL